MQGPYSFTEPSFFTSFCFILTILFYKNLISLRLYYKED
jgi:hypothetical protein